MISLIIPSPTIAAKCPQEWSDVIGSDVIEFLVIEREHVNHFGFREERWDEKSNQELSMIVKEILS